MPIINPDWVPPIALTFDEGKPIRSEQGLLLAGNPIAIAQGKSGAPRIYLRALERLEAGDEIRSRNDESRSISGIETLHFFDFLQYGTIRVQTEITSLSGTTTVSIIRLRNGAETTLGTRGTVGILIVDVGVLPGDRVTIIATGSEFGTLVVQNARFSTDGQDLWPGSLARLEGNRAAT